MLTWTVGDVTIKRIVETEVPVPYNEKAPFMPGASPEALKGIDWMSPFITEKGWLLLSIHALLIEAPGIRMIVDTCIGNDKPRGLTRHAPLATAFLEHLKQAGAPRESIDTVVCTHLHVDHVGWNTMRDGDKWVPTFPNARYLVGREEYAHWSREDVGDDEHKAVMADSVRPIFDAGLADLVAMDQRISPEIRLMATTGHTPGHVSVVIESNGQTAIITGDMMHHPCQIAHPDWATPYDSSRRKAVETRRARLGEWADTPTLIIGTHFATPTAGRIRRDGETFRFET